MTTTARVIQLQRNFKGKPKKEDFKIVEETIKPLEDGEIMFETEYVSVDPYMRPYTAAMKTPVTMIGSIVAKVTESKDADYPVGCYIVAYAGWVERGKLNPSKLRTQQDTGIPAVVKAPDIGSKIEKSLLLGACGMPGNTAYFGFLELCKPKEGETVVVNGAAGAVGSLVGQIAKIKGCRVIGFAGSDEKVNWLKKELGFDYVFNYKKADLKICLQNAAPRGVDCFFDNVGGPASSEILGHMNTFGRIAVCGSISTYNDEKPTMARSIQGPMVFKQLKMEGFLVARWVSRWNEGITQMAEWIEQGKIKTKETFIDGFERTPEAMIGLFEGTNLGKMVVRVK